MGNMLLVVFLIIIVYSFNILSFACALLFLRLLIHFYISDWIIVAFKFLSLFDRLYHSPFVVK